jgi:allantoinase
MPGLVDTHVHVNEPGRTEWEGFKTAGRAAAAGGITSIVVMPLNCTPAATTADALRAEAQAAAGQCLVDFGLWGGIVPGNTRELEAMWSQGALGFKCFLTDSGVDNFPRVPRRDLEAAMPEAARLGAVVLAHAEDPEALESAHPGSGLDNAPRSYRAYLASRPPEAEERAIETMIDLCRRTRARTHIVHVSAASSLPIIEAARRQGLPLTAETCPHYLALAAEDIPDGATHFKCAPPIRERANQSRLWAALGDAVLDAIVSDHSPCPPALKRLDSGDFTAAWGGISSLQLSLPIVWTQAQLRGFQLADVSRWMSAAPAQLAGVNDRKGRIAPGYDADLVVFHPDESWRVDASNLQHRHKLTPYDGATLRGSVKATFLRGRQIYAANGFEHLTPLDNQGFATEATGQWLKRTRE